MNITQQHEICTWNFDKFSINRGRKDSEDSLDENFGHNDWTKWLNGFAFDYEDY